MNERTSQRKTLNFTQTEAARRAGVSLATWRRWEEDPDGVSGKTSLACERVLAKGIDLDPALADDAQAIVVAWGDSERLTPRQAYALAAELDILADLFLSEWLIDPRQPLHTVSPFDRFDLRIMMLVDESRAWVEAVVRRCHAVSDEIRMGVLPFDRPGPFIDELLMAVALTGAQSTLEDMPELFEAIPSRSALDDEREGIYVLGDDDWDLVSDGFDDECQWDEWEIPLQQGHPLLPAILADRHPFSWFDSAEPSGAGYLQRLSGLLAEQEAD